MKMAFAIMQKGWLTMDEYIKRGAVLAKAYWHGDSCTQSNPYPDGVEAVDVSAIEQIPAADVRPVVHGEWTYIAHVPFGHDYECSVCKQRNYEKSNFCPYCGAVMRDNPVIIGLDMGGEDAKS